MYYLLFIVYLALFCLALNHIGFVKNAGLNRKTVFILFLIKIAAGLFIGYITQNYLGGGDYNAANIYGRDEYTLLMKDPYKFFTDVFNAEYSGGYGGMFDSVNSFWHDLAGNCLYKLLGIFNILSRGNFYINTLLLNFIGFFGHIALFRVFNDVYKIKEWPLIAGCFLIPSTLYFSSGLHKDNLTFTALCVFSYAIYFIIKSTPSFNKIILLVLTAIVLFLVRNYVLVALIPAAIAFWMATKSGKPWRSFFSVYAIVFLSTVFFVLLSPARNPLYIIVQKQRDFLGLATARTQLTMDTLKPTLASFAKNVPPAFEHSFLRPYIWEKQVPYLVIPGIEILAYILIFAMALFFTKINWEKPPPFVLFGIFSSITIFLFIGFVIPNLGSVIRYRSLYLPFLLTPIIVQVSNHIRKINI